MFKYTLYKHTVWGHFCNHTMRGNKDNTVTVLIFLLPLMLNFVHWTLIGTAISGFFVFFFLILVTLGLHVQLLWGLYFVVKMCNIQYKSCNRLVLFHSFLYAFDILSLCDKVYSWTFWSMSLIPPSGDFRACELAVWNTTNYNLLASSTAACPIHAVQWDPFTVNEFISVGEHGTVLFWLLDETSSDVCLNMHLAQLPEELEGKWKKNVSITKEDQEN